MLADLRSHLATRPWLVALLLGLAAQLLFTVHIDRPSRIMFDETHYVTASRTLIEMTEPVNKEHPLLGKEMIAGGILVFGDNPYGWRLMSSFAGTATVIAGFAFLFLLMGAMRPAIVGALLMMLNQMLFIQARIGMLDIFLGAFLLWALVLMLWAMHGTPRQVLWRWIGASALLGLAVGVKWAAIPYVALAGLAFLLLRMAEHRGAPAAALLGTTHRRWPGMSTIGGLALLGGVSIPVYLLTFLPAFFYASEPMTLAGLIPFQIDMYRLQTQVLASHTYQSSWWSWPLMIRPIWYFYELDMGYQRGVLLIGNPLIMWGGLIAVIACLVAWFRERAARPLSVALLWISSVAIYIVIPKSLGFYYYYYLSSLFLCFALAVAFHHYDRKRMRGWEEWFTAASLLMFGYFYPIISAGPLADAQRFNFWMWLPSWR